MNETLTFDVAVVGAGPGGSTAALTLSQAGFRVAIVEKAVLPRYKTCGGGLLWRSRTWLPLELETVIERTCHRAELVHHDPALRFNTERKDPIVSMVMRDRFDQLITNAAQSAGAMLIQGSPVLDIVEQANDIQLHTQDKKIEARFVIAADGVSSVIARKAKLPELKHVIPALECEVEVTPDTFARFNTAARFDFGLTPFGYGWVFPKRDHLSIGVLTTRRGSCNLNEEYTRYVSHLQLGAVAREQRHGYMIPLQPRDRLFDRRRILFVGDAAGLVDPITAEGISAAILSGRLAAASIARHHSDPEEVRCAYRDALTERLLIDLRAARRLARVLYGWPKVRGFVFRKQGHALAEFLTRVVMGEMRYRDALRRPRNYLKLLGGKRPASDPTLSAPRR